LSTRKNGGKIKTSSTKKRKMTKGNPNIASKGVKFSREYQPTPKAKSEGKRRIINFKEAMSCLGEKPKTTIEIEGETIELTYYSNIAYKLLEKANDGDLKAIEMIMKIEGWEAPKKTENTNIEGVNIPIKEWLKNRSKPTETNE
jgi:hypothetical protein